MPYPTVNTFTSEKNWRKTYPPANGVSVVMDVPRWARHDTRRHEEAVRTWMEQAARRLAIRTYEETFGPIVWDRTEFIVAHLTIQCLVEIRVETEQ